MGERNTRTLQFFEGLYVDLHHLAGNVATATGHGRIGAGACDLGRVGAIRRRLKAVARVGA